jgi:hypothetical protein
MHDPNALRTLLRLGSPSNLPGTQDPYAAKRMAQTALGEDELAPSDFLLKQAQVEQARVPEDFDPQSTLHGPVNSLRHAPVRKPASPGMFITSHSRDEMRDAGIGLLKQKLGLQAAEHGMEMERETAKARVEGEYDLRGRELSNEGQMNVARTYADQRAETAQNNLAAREAAYEEMRLAAEADPNRSVSRSGVGSIGAARQDPAAKGPSAGVRTQIARERAALAKAVSEAEPYAISKMFGRTNPRQAELEMFDTTLAYADKILREYPGMSAEEALAEMGQSPDPNELGQIQKFMLMLGQ